MDRSETENLGAYTVTLAADQAGEDIAQGQWIHLIPAGEFTARDGRGPFSAGDAGKIVAASIQYAGTRQIPVDYEHQTDNAPKNGQPAPAAGWIKTLQARADGVWGLVEWTAKAVEHLKAKEYRYLSPVFNYREDGEVTRVLRAALTNNPALTELTALARAQDRPAAGPSLDDIRAVLGMSETDDNDTVLARVNELAKDRHGREEERIMLAVSKAVSGGHMPDTMHDFGLSLCRIDPALFDQFVTLVSPFFRFLRGTQTGGKPPDGVEGRFSSMNDDERAICQALGHTEDDLMKYGDC